MVEAHPAPTPRLAFLLSGTGRTLENMAAVLAERPELGSLVAVVSDRPGARGLEKAERLGLEARVLPCRSPADSAAIFAYLDDRGVDLALLGGWLRLLEIPAHWEGRVLNIHPSLIPRFSGRGFYGQRVHEAVLAAGETESGCTVHFVDNIYDHGPIVLQERVPVLPGDDADTLATRVFEAECRAYPRALELLATGQVRWERARTVAEESP